MILLHKNEYMAVRTAGAQELSTPVMAEGNEPRPSPLPSSEEIPHPRGPAVLGVEDLGLQNGKDIQLPLSDAGTTIENREGQISRGQPISDRSETTDRDRDIVLSDEVAGREAKQDTQTHKETEDLKEQPSEETIEF
jgi:hypothetical protein